MRVTLPFADDLTWIALTVKQEAEGEPRDGKLAVAYVMMNRAKKFNRSIPDVIFDPWDFSAWNTESPTRLRLDNIGPELWYECMRAACAAAFGLLPDPTEGATHYLNVELTKKIRGDGSLPHWVSRLEKTADIGRHTFFKEVL